MTPVLGNGWLTMIQSDASVTLMPGDITHDYFLGQKLHLAQPASGYRAGIDAVLLAASVVPPADGSDLRVLDVGAGVGAAGLCLAARLPSATVVLYERAPELVALAQSNIASNAFAERVVAVEGDVAITGDRLAALGLEPQSFDWVIANPPFHDSSAGTQAPDPLKAGSHAMELEQLDTWLRFMARMVRAGGRASIIYKANGLTRLLQGFDGRFGGVSVLPIVPRRGAPAIRVLIEGVKGSRAPLTLKSNLVLHGHGQGFLPQIETILRDGGGLDQAIVQA